MEEKRIDIDKCIKQWIDEAPEGEKRSFIGIAVTNNGEAMSLDCYAMGYDEDLEKAIVTNLRNSKPENQTGKYLRRGAARLFAERILGALNFMEE